MERRFIRNIPTITEAQQSLLRTKCAAVIGCGGLGGYAAEMLARAGVGALTVCDGDMFEESNLNRQNLALPGNLGQNKAIAAAERIRAIDETIALRAFPEHFTAENAGEILAGVDIVIDALDSVPSRILLEDECAGRKLPLIHGAVEGRSLQVAVPVPGGGGLKRLYAETAERAVKSVLAPTAAVCAGLQCAEALKILCGEESPLLGRLMLGDLESMEFHTISL